MKVPVRCMLMLVSAVCGPGFAQEGTYVDPKEEQTTHVEPKQGGTYVDPKEERTHVEPKQGGTYVDPKREGTYMELKQNCGGKLTVDGSGTTITSPGYPSNYGNGELCEWTIKAQDPDATLKLKCSAFNLKPSRKCKGDRLVIFEGTKLKKKFCGTGRKSYVSKENTIRIKFRTNRRGTSSGFSCVVRSISPSSGEICSCGIANENRIVGGQVVSPKNKYPWQVGLKKQGGSNYWCGGSIINTDYVMTAAHCFFDSRGNRESDEGLVVGVADHNMYSTSDDVPGVTRLVTVERVIIHPQYSPSDIDYDIALLKLKKTLDLSQHKQLRAVCLPADDSKTYEGVTATASGWGTLTSGGRQPAKLQEVSVPILPPSCWSMSGITERMLCAGLKEGGKDTCQGDSGGPLYVQEGSKYVQVGITSWGYGCAAENSPGVYARVSKFVSWIKSNTADATYCQ